jgi:hypothetical protein
LVDNRKPSGVAVLALGDHGLPKSAFERETKAARGGLAWCVEGEKNHLRHLLCAVVIAADLPARGGINEPGVSPHEFRKCFWVPVANVSFQCADGLVALRVSLARAAGIFWRMEARSARQR